MIGQVKENVQVVVDDRERPSGVVPELEKLGRIVVKIEHLSLGDYCIDGAVLIERKTAADFAQSLIDGRLFGQAGRMAASSMRPAYILGREQRGMVWPWRVARGAPRSPGYSHAHLRCARIPVFRPG
jgi:ERCC4-type nuclease